MVQLFWHSHHAPTTCNSQHVHHHSQLGFPSNIRECFPGKSGLADLDSPPMERGDNPLLSLLCQHQQLGEAKAQHPVDNPGWRKDRLRVGSLSGTALLTLYTFISERKWKQGRSNSITLQNSQSYK